jgi:hypothetical protein
MKLKPTTYKFTNDINKVKFCYEILQNHAKQKKMIWYGELYPLIDLKTDNAGDRNIGASLLAEVNILSYEEKAVLISAIVTLKQANAPAEGFYNFAKSEDVGLLKSDADEDEDEQFWVNQVKKVFNVFG